MSHIFYISHGGGPLPLLADPAHQELVHNLQTLSASIPKPKAIIVFSAHWESDEIHITSHVNPELIYDYSGFPEESYQITYPALGNPELATQVSERLSMANIPNQLNPNRGFDHGLFVPLKLMYPHADIPCIQVSLNNNLDPQLHLDIGKALQALTQQDILFIGSGFSFHNMHAFFNPTTQSTQANLEFEAWLDTTLGSHIKDEATRQQHLLHWETAPAARFCHPREEHLLPIHVCYGLVQAPYTQHYIFKALGVQASAFHWKV